MEGLDNLKKFFIILGGAITGVYGLRLNFSAWEVGILVAVITVFSYLLFNKVLSKNKTSDDRKNTNVLIFIISFAALVTIPLSPYVRSYISPQAKNMSSAPIKTIKIADKNISETYKALQAPNLREAQQKKISLSPSGSLTKYLTNGNYAEAKKILERLDEQGDINASYQLGKLYELGQGVEKDIFLSLDYYEKSCKKDHMRACYRLGLLYDNECKSGFKANSTKAVKLFDKACKGGYPRACAQYGHMLKYGEGVEKNITKAISLFREYCDEKYSSLLACVELGYVYKNGVDAQGYTIEKNSAEAGRRFARACNKGELAGCVGLAFLHRDGEEGHNQDYLKSFELFKKSCQQGYSRGCSGMGYAYEKSLGVEKNSTLAYKHYEQGCDGCDMWGCNNQGNFLEYGRGISKDEAKAKELYEKACKGRYYYACINLGTMYRDGKGGLDENPEKAIKLYSKAQEHGILDAYSALGTTYEYGLGVDKNETLAFSYYDKGCKNKNNKSCNALASCYMRGVGRKKNPTKSKEILENSCGREDSGACFFLGALHEGDKDIPKEMIEKNYKKALSYYEKSCILRVEAACVKPTVMLKDDKLAKSIKNIKIALKLLTKKVQRKKYKKEIEWLKNLKSKKECDQADSYQAYNIGLSLMEKKDIKTALYCLDQSCKKGESDGCSEYADIYYGKGVKKDYKKSLKYFKLGCELEDAYSCYSLGYFYTYDSGNAMDEDKAIKFLRKARKLGSTDAGKILKDEFKE